MFTVIQGIELIEGLEQTKKTPSSVFITDDGGLKNGGYLLSHITAVPST